MTAVSSKSYYGYESYQAMQYDMQSLSLMYSYKISEMRHTV